MSHLLGQSGGAERRPIDHRISASLVKRARKTSACRTPTHERPHDQIACRQFAIEALSSHLRPLVHYSGRTDTTVGFPR